MTVTRSYSRTNGGSQRLWTGVYRDGLQRIATDAHVPALAMRVWLLALGGVEANGHCPLGEGVEELLGVTRTSANRAIRQAVAHGLLTSQSHRRCLVLPAEIVHTANGHAWTACPRHKEN